MDLEDKVALPWMAAFTRVPHPKKSSGSRIPRWAPIPFPRRAPWSWSRARPPNTSSIGWQRPDRKTIALAGGPSRPRSRARKCISTSTNLDSVAVLLNDKLLDLDKPVAFYWKGAKVHEGLVAQDGRPTFFAASRPGATGN